MDQLRVKIIADVNFDDFQDSINDFLLTNEIKVYDIKFTQTMDEEFVHCTALIMYRNLEDYQDE